MFEKYGHVVDSFGLSLGDGGASEPDGGHGVGFVVDKKVIGDLDPGSVVIHQFVRVLFEVGEVSTDRLGRIFWLKRFETFLLNVIPDVKVDVVILQQFVSGNGTVPEAHFELPNLAGFIPGGDFGSIFNSVNQDVGKDGVFFTASIKQQNIH